jgi:hypothetical protein
MSTPYINNVAEIGSLSGNVHSNDGFMGLHLNIISTTAEEKMFDLRV